MMVAVWIVVGLLFAGGLAGSFLPFLPGTPLIFLGALIYAFATDFDVIGPWRLVILAVVAAVAWVLSHLAGAAGARRAGGSRWAVAGALVGTVVGLFFAPVGLFVGPLLGAVAGELLRTGKLEESLRSGVGAFLGMVAGAVAQIAFALVMIALFGWWVWRG